MVETDEVDLVLDGGRVVITRDDPERVVLDVIAPGDCYLVIRDGWNPEWTAKVDGDPATIYPADAAFRAVRVPSGTHTVEFLYIPSGFYFGRTITIISLILLVILYSISGGKTRNIIPTPSKR